MQAMAPPQRAIAQAAGAWLQYEFACGRSNLFNERYLSTPVSSVLRHLYAHEVRAEYLHPVLAPAKSGMRGRRPEVDFAVIEAFPKVSCVVETKWLGKDGLTSADIIWDLMRLELIAHEGQARAFFVMAGRRKHLASFFKSKTFLGTPTRKGRVRPLLNLAAGQRGARIHINSPSPDRAAAIAKLVAPYQQISFPNSISTSPPAIYPAECPQFQYQALAWEVFAPPRTHRFLPVNHSAYAKLGA